MSSWGVWGYWGIVTALLVLLMVFFIGVESLYSTPKTSGTGEAQAPAGSPEGTDTDVKRVA